ncbi:hypothetical protein QCA50_012105 [Cerrena zonata]|uniref:Transposase n=1 Tax=Cerrena zonata TaxID=2478898 RepID=A0AAW0G568_9APHY
MTQPLPDAAFANLPTIKPDFFQKTSYKHQLTKYKDNDAELGSKQLTALASCSADKWKKFWKHIKTYYFSLDVNTDHIHIFNLGLKLWTFVNKPQCLFCGRQVKPRFSRDLDPDGFSPMSI